MVEHISGLPNMMIMIVVDHSESSNIILMIIEHPFHVKQIMLTWFACNQSFFWYFTLALHAHGSNRLYVNVNFILRTQNI
jgi:hypothetical protein